MSVMALKVLRPVDQFLIYQMQMQRTTFLVKDCLNYFLLVSFAMYLSSVLVVKTNSISTDHRMTKQSLSNFSAVLNHIEFVNWSPGLSQMSSFHIPVKYTIFGHVYNCLACNILKDFVLNTCQPNKSFSG